MKKLIALSTLLLPSLLVFAGGIGATDDDIIFYAVLSLALLIMAGMVALGRFVFTQVRAISWLPYPYFLYMYSFWRRYC